MTYTYVCNQCGHKVTEQVKIDERQDVALSCPECGEGVLIREYHAVPIIFRGDGWGGSQ